MSKRWLEVLFVFFLGVMLPAMILATFNENEKNEFSESTVIDVEQTVLQQTQATQPQQEVEISVLMDDESVQNMELEKYIIGVVLQEMPAEFELEALKAQAVVARTYTMRRQESGYKHQTASVCTDPSCCQGYCSEEQYILRGGTQVEIDKIIQAVVATKGQVLTYNEKLIDATYFSCSGGVTEDAAAVWGADVPYLQSIESPGEEAATHYTDTVSYTTEKLSQLLGVSLQGMQKDLVSSITYTNGGGVDKIKIGGKEFTGTQLRKLLNLHSTAFSISVIGNIVTITTHGYGHRVGMSQYGADAMAVNGSSYAEILAHYYQGTSLSGY